MRNVTLPGLSPLWLMGLALALGVLLVTAVPVLLSEAPIDSKAWLGFAGSAFSAAVAVLAIIVAVYNVNRQLRISLLIREEDRMEKHLPGLRRAAGEANLLIKRLKSAKNPIEIRRLFNEGQVMTRQGFRNNSLTERLKDIDPNLKRDYFRVHYALARKAGELNSAEKAAASAGPKATDEILEIAAIAQIEFEDGLKEFEAFAADIDARILTYEARLPRFRSQVEEYLMRD